MPTLEIQREIGNLAQETPGLQLTPIYPDACGSLNT